MNTRHDFYGWQIGQSAAVSQIKQFNSLKDFAPDCIIDRVYFPHFARKNLCSVLARVAILPNCAAGKSFQ
ncbi:hypothetical protein [Conchiformibius steedae]|uniref:hypothetical protein n=1 Tax=Conchiformibius steedae TaxID=153493 RepID=UPI0026EAC98F|nr:hypothetical protein [Conchiformibius steedae]